MEGGKIINSSDLHEGNTLLEWVAGSSERKTLLIISFVLILLQFWGLKYLYPFPNFLPDSYSYLEAAYNNQLINVWPIGYSKFLRLFSCFTKSHVVLVLFQYLFLYCSIFYFVLSTAHQLSFGKWLLRIMLAMSVLNPLIFFISNFISSDAIFAGLSILWLTQLFQIIARPTRRLFLYHGVVLLLAFTFRYNAIYYPLISMITIMFTAAPFRHKITGCLTVALLIGSFMLITIREYKTATGMAQFSAFGGWQMASNALYAYAHVKPEGAETMPARFRPLQQVVFHHNDSLWRIKYRPDGELGIYYLWEESAPLKRFLGVKYKTDSSTNNLARWTSMAPLYFDYGLYLIAHHPKAYLRHYLLPNMKNYYVPPIEFLGIFNMISDRVQPVAKDWFGMKSDKIYKKTSGILIKETQNLPVALAVINLLYVLCFLAFLYLGLHKKISRQTMRIIWYFMAIWVCNFGFSVLASPIVMRYQVFPFVTTVTFLLFLLHFIIQETRSSVATKVTAEEEMELYQRAYN